MYFASNIPTTAYQEAKAICTHVYYINMCKSIIAYMHLRPSYIDSIAMQGINRYITLVCAYLDRYHKPPGYPMEHSRLWGRHVRSNGYQHAGCGVRTRTVGGPGRAMGLIF